MAKLRCSCATFMHHVNCPNAKDYKPLPAICTKAAGHDGDCNGFPRLINLGTDKYCRDLVKRFDPQGKEMKSLGEYVRERLDLIETQQETIAELRTTVERLERALRAERDAFNDRGSR